MNASEVGFDLQHWKLNIGLPCYLLQCAVFTVLIRAFIFTFRAWALQRGDFPDSEKEPGKELRFGRAFWECFGGFSRSKAHADLWLNAIIGFAELFTYPFLLNRGYLIVIGRLACNKNGGNLGRLDNLPYIVQSLLSH